MTPEVPNWDPPALAGALDRANHHPGLVLHFGSVSCDRSWRLMIDFLRRTTP